MRLTFALTPLFLLAVHLLAGEELPALPDAPPSGIERGIWQVENWGNSGSSEKVTDAVKAVKLNYKGDKKEKAAFKHPTTLGIDREGKVRVNIYAPDDAPPQLALAILTTRAFRWHESKPQALKKGWNKLEFAIGLKEWKTQTSDWKYTVPVEPADDVRTIELLVFNGDKSGALYAQGLSYDPDENGKKAAALLKDLASDNAEVRSKAEKGLIAIGRPASEALHQLPDDVKPEVVQRAALVLRQIEMLPEDMPLDPAERAQIEKKLEERSLDEARRRMDNALRSIDGERVRLTNVLKDVQNEVAQDRSDLDGFKNVDPEKKKACEEALTKLEGIAKDADALLKALPVLDIKPPPTAEQKPGKQRMEKETDNAPREAPKEQPKEGKEK